MLCILNRKNFKIILNVYLMFFLGSSITFLNSSNAFCVGDTIQFNCTVNSPETSYRCGEAGLSIDVSGICHTAEMIEAGTIPRLHFTSTTASLTAPPGLYTISPYLMQDSTSTFRCCSSLFGSSSTHYTTSITPSAACT